MAGFRPGLSMYAESLSNIKQVSVVATLPRPSNDTTTASIKPSQYLRGWQDLVLEHDNHYTIHLTIPGLVDEKSLVPDPPEGNTEVSWRFPVIENAEHVVDSELGYPKHGWSAKSLEVNLLFACRSCGQQIVGWNVIREWKDLPSENWAEMMEFWHCHKPDDAPEDDHSRSSEDDPTSHSHSKDKNQDRGYGANSRFSARKGLGFIDILTFLLAEEDCLNITKSTRPNAKYQKLSCKRCSSYLGHEDPISTGFRFYKWCLDYVPPPPSEEFPEEEDEGVEPVTISSMLLYTEYFSSILESQVTSRLLLTPLNHSFNQSHQDSKTGDEQKEFLSLWIMSPSIHFSYYEEANPMAFRSSQHAMKIFFQIPSLAEAEGLARNQASEEVYLPVESIVEIRKELTASSARLPKSARRFGMWDVGLLERFENRNVEKINWPHG